jgi:hypothetical protein
VLCSFRFKRVQKMKIKVSNKQKVGIAVAALAVVGLLYAYKHRDEVSADVEALVKDIKKGGKSLDAATKKLQKHIQSMGLDLAKPKKSKR